MAHRALDVFISILFSAIIQNKVHIFDKNKYLIFNFSYENKLAGIVPFSWNFYSIARSRYYPITATVS